MEEIKIFELFAGIGAPRNALRNIGVPYKSIGYSEIDKNPIKAYCKIYNDKEGNNYGDISKIKELPKDIDLLFHGSPCQNFSLANSKRKGGDEGSGTTSSLMWETVRLIKGALPKIVIWENVTGALDEKNKHNFNKYLKALESMGYKNTFSVFTGTDFNIPQIRKRVLVVSFFKGENYINIDYVKKKPLEKN